MLQSQADWLDRRNLRPKNPVNNVVSFEITKMTSLEFKNLPLAEVTCHVLSSVPLGVDRKYVRNVEDALQSMGFHLISFSSNPFNVGLTPFSMPSAVYENVNGVTVSITDTGISCAWKQSGSNLEYVRFAFLMKALAATIAVVPSYRTSIVNLTYVNQISGEMNVFDLLIQDVLPKIAANPIKEYNVAWNLSSGEEFRLTIRPGDDFTILSTASGMNVSDDISAKPLETLQRIHAALQTQFKLILSSRAVEQWQLQS